MLFRSRTHIYSMLFFSFVWWGCMATLYYTFSFTTKYLFCLLGSTCINIKRRAKWNKIKTKYKYNFKTYMDVLPIVFVHLYLERLKYFREWAKFNVYDHKWLNPTAYDLAKHAHSFHWNFHLLRTERIACFVRLHRFINCIWIIVDIILICICESMLHVKWCILTLWLP